MWQIIWHTQLHHSVCTLTSSCDAFLPLQLSCYPDNDGNEDYCNEDKQQVAHGSSSHNGSKANSFWVV